MYWKQDLLDPFNKLELREASSMSTAHSLAWLSEKLRLIFHQSDRPSNGLMRLNGFGDISFTLPGAPIRRGRAVEDPTLGEISSLNSIITTRDLLPATEH